MGWHGLRWGRPSHLALALGPDKPDLGRMSCLALALNGHKLNGHGRGVAEPAEIWTAHGHRDRRDLIELVFNRLDLVNYTSKYTKSRRALIAQQVLRATFTTLYRVIKRAKSDISFIFSVNEIKWITRLDFGTMGKLYLCSTSRSISITVNAAARGSMRLSWEISQILRDLTPHTCFLNRRNGHLTKLYPVDCVVSLILLFF